MQKLKAARGRRAQAGAALASSEGLRSEDSSSAACEGAALAHLSGSASGSAGTGARGAGRARVKEEAHDSPDEHLVGLSKQELKRAQNRRIQHRFREKERVRAPPARAAPPGSARPLGALRQDPTGARQQAARATGPRAAPDRSLPRSKHGRLRGRRLATSARRSAAP